MEAEEAKEVAMEKGGSEKGGAEVEKQAPHGVDDSDYSDVTCRRRRTNV